MPIKIKGGSYPEGGYPSKINKEISFELTGNQNKANLWVYGDSFAAQPAPWLDMIAKEFNLNHTNHAWPGSSLDYSSVQINKTMNSWTEKDVVIVCLTEVLRVWERWEHKVLSYVDNKFVSIQHLQHHENKDFRIFSRHKCFFKMSFCFFSKNIFHCKSCI